MPDRRWIALLLPVLVLAVFAQVRDHEFVDYDDRKHIVENPDVASGLSAKSALRVFTRPHYGDFIPLTYLSLQLDRSLFGPGAAGTLLVNVALHAASAVLLFLALVRMTGAVGRSAFVAAVFAVHPLHVESVAWAFERKDALSGMLWMLALWLYAGRAPRGEGAERLWPVALCLGLGLLAKPMLVTLPFALLLVDYWPLGRLGGGPQGATLEPARLRAAVAEKWPLFALSGVAVAWTLASHASASVYPGAELTLAERLAGVPGAYLFYLAKSLWPVGLAVHYPHEAALHGGGLARAGAIALGLVALTAGALAAARRRPWLASGWLWFLGTLVPVIGIVQVGLHAVADRYAYLPQVGLAWIVAWGAADALGRTASARRALAAAGLAAVVALAGLAWRQVGTWRDTQTLFEHVLAVHGDDFLAHWRLGVLHAQAGRRDQAIEHLRASVASEPGLGITHFELAQTLEEAGERDAAFRHYRRALEIDPDQAGANGRYGVALLEQGRGGEARPLLERSLAADGAQPRVQAALGAVYAGAGRDADAVARYREALRLEPGYAPVANNLAYLLATSGDARVRNPREAIRLARAALEILPDEPAVMDTLALGLAADGRVDEAIRTAARALELARARGDAALAAEIEGHLERYRNGAGEF